MPHDVELGFNEGQPLAVGGPVWIDGHRINATKVELLVFDGEKENPSVAKLRIEILCRSVKTRDVGPQGEER